MDVGLSRSTSPKCSLDLVYWGSCASLHNPLVLSAELGCLLSGTMGTFHLPWMHVPCTQCGHNRNMESFTIYGLGVGVTLSGERVEPNQAGKGLSGPASWNMLS